MPSPIPLLDTNILSELIRPAPHPGVLAWAEEHPRVALSAVTVEEISYGLAWRPKDRVILWFEWFLDESCEVLPVTLMIARRAGELRGGLQRRGAERDQADMLIAATAQVHQLTLVTHNLRHFEGCGIPLFDPFETPG